MDIPSEFPATARELLERHMAETAPELGASVEAGQSTPEPRRPEHINYAELAAERAGYSYGSMDMQQEAALRTNDRINADYFEHASQGHERDNTAREALEQHMAQAERQTERQPEEHSSTAREALEQHLQDAKREITVPTFDPNQHMRQDLGFER